MTDTPETLARECRTLTRYLVGVDPDPGTVRRYQNAHDTLPALLTRNRFDSLTVRFARTHPWCARAADGFAVFFAGNGLLRHKLVTLLAILETTGTTSRGVDQASGAPTWWVVLRLASAGTMSVVFALLGTLCLLPFRLFYGRDARG